MRFDLFTVLMTITITLIHCVCAFIYRRPLIRLLPAQMLESTIYAGVFSLELSSVYLYRSPGGHLLPAWTLLLLVHAGVVLLLLHVIVTYYYLIVLSNYEPLNRNNDCIG